MYDIINITLILSITFGSIAVLSIYTLIKQKDRVKSFLRHLPKPPLPQTNPLPLRTESIQVDASSFTKAFNNLPVLSKLDQMTTELFLASKFENKDILKSLIDIATEVWQIQKRIEKLEISTSDDLRLKGVEISIGKIMAVLDSNNIKMLDYTGQKYSDGMNGIEIISREQSDKTQIDIIQNTLEPGIELCGVLHKKAKVTILSPL